MTINLSVPLQTTHQLRPRITVVGVGGGGCNAVNNMIEANLEGVDFLVANTDGQSLSHSKADRKVQLGTQLTGGLGAGSKPEIGQRAAEESLDAVMAELTDCNMVFITAGMGGGTGTGAAPVIARAAREQGILTVGVVTKPFHFEGKRRMTQAEEGVKSLQEVVDTLIVIPNQNLFTRANEQTRFTDAFSMADTVLHQGVSGVTDLIIKPGLINLDFADIKSVMLEMGKAMMGTGEASGENRAREAAEAAINNPLLDHSSMHGASALLINITGGYDMTLFEVDEAANRVKQEIDEDATIVFGTAFDDSMDNIMRVSVVATGIEAELSRALPPQHNPLHGQSTPILTRPVAAAAAAAPAMHLNSAAPAGMAETAPSFAPAAEMAEQAPDITAETAEEAQPEQPAEIKAESTDTAEMNMPQTIEQEPAAIAETAEMAADENQQHTDAVPAQIDLETLARERTERSEQAIQAMQEERNAADDTPDAEQPNIVMPAPKTPEAEHSPLGQSHNQATIIRKPSFPLRATTQPVEAPEVPATAAMPQSRPSLFNRISKAFQASQAETAKPEATPSEPAASATPREEPVLKRTDAVLPHVEEPTIMDLPKPDVVQTTLPVEPSSAQSEMDDDMDIPAFLRRQAN